MRLIIPLWIATGFWTAVLSALGADLESTFFESKVRPLIADHCQECHNPEKRKGGLDLESQAGFLTGGDSGAVLMPGDPDASRLIKAVRYSNPDLQMPPRYKLDESAVDLLTAWVRDGAYWPEDRIGIPKKHDSEGSDTRVASLDSHWWSRPVSRPDIPEISLEGWIRNEVDAFVLDKLEDKGLKPAEKASDLTLLRRLYFDLIGLPPPVEAVRATLTTGGGEAYFQGVIQQLLDDPGFGERWARHWLDLVRYAETMGHEFDYPIPEAWRYRDYVVRAFNEDLPYDRFVKEHLAGDLINPRLRDEGGLMESPIGTAFFWFPQQVHSPVDIKQNQADLIDNQIDVLSKTFMGLTVACARCHDHKFDAVTTRDFYSLYGILSSSRYHEADIRNPVMVQKETQLLRMSKARLKNELIQEGLKALDRVESRIKESDKQEILDTRILPIWYRDLWEIMGLESRMQTANRIEPPIQTQQDASSDIVLWSAATERIWGDWHLTGQAFAHAFEPQSLFVHGDMDEPVKRFIHDGEIRSNCLSDRLQGAARSHTFVISKPYLHVWASGREARLNVVIENFNLIRAPIYGGLKRVLKEDEFNRHTFELSMWLGKRAYVEFKDIALADLAGPGSGSDAWFAFNRILLSDSKEGVDLKPPAQRTFSDHRIAIDAMRKALAKGAGQSKWDEEDLELLEQMRSAGVWSTEKNELFSGESLRETLSELQGLEAVLRDPIYVPSMVEGTPLDEHVFIRGSHRNPGDLVRRGFLECLDPEPFRSESSGRLAWAEWLTSTEHPLTARVMVNRIWHHIFGHGLVRSPDDFGHMGQPPTHPDLLDWLSHWFVHEANWSIKSLVKLLVSSETYRMQSTAQDPPRADAIDPSNLFFHRMPIKRLEGEVLRDAVLFVSGGLNPMSGGESVPVYLTRFMEGRGRPVDSGPLDGNGRRSIYLEVRRNFLNPTMLAFDTPVPSTTTGKRSVSNVPAQSLILMNDPFILSQSDQWARVLKDVRFENNEGKLTHLFLSALGRPLSGEEMDLCLSFLKAEHDAAESDQVENREEDPWSDLCHAVLNMKEFYFVN